MKDTFMVAKSDANDPKPSGVRSIRRAFAVRNDTGKVATIETANTAGNAVEVLAHSGAVMHTDGSDVSVEGREFFVAGFISGLAPRTR